MKMNLFSYLIQSLMYLNSSSFLCQFQQKKGKCFLNLFFLSFCNYRKLTCSIHMQQLKNRVFYFYNHGQENIVLILTHQKQQYYCQGEMDSQTGKKGIENMNWKVFMDSGALCYELLSQLMKKTFQGVGMQNAKRMAPKHTYNQVTHAIESSVSLSFTQKFDKNPLITDEKDFKPPKIDNLAVQEIDSQKLPRTKTDTPLLSIIESASTTKSRLKTKKAEGHNSFRQRKFTQISQEDAETKIKIISNFEKIPEIINPFDFSEDPQLNKVRSNFLKIEKQNLERKIQLQSLQQKNLEEKQINTKMVKTSKKITYDYEGKIILQGNGLSQQSKLMVINNRFSALKKTKDTSKLKIDPIFIDTQRKKDLKDKKITKQTPMFREKAQSIIQAIENDKGIAKGVKIIQQLGKNQSLTKQNPLKRTVANSLIEFKNTTKQLKFKDYRPISLNKSFSTINNQQVSQKSIVQKGPRRGSFHKESKSKSSSHNGKGIELLEELNSSRIEHSILESIDERISSQRQKLKYHGLPFIKTKGYKAVDIESQRSFKYVLDELGESRNKSKLRNKIHINDHSLLKHTLEGI